MRDTGVAGEFFLEGLHLLAENIPAAFEHRVDGRPDFGRHSAELRLKVHKGNHAAALFEPVYVSRRNTTIRNQSPLRFHATRAIRGKLKNWDLPCARS